MKLSFSEDGKYFAHLTNDGKLKLWNTVSNSLEQEYVPDYHLTTPCTCLRFLDTNKKNPKQSYGPSTPKKKRRDSITTPFVLLGSSSGSLLIYSIAEAKLRFTVNSDSGEQINCLSTSEDHTVYAGGDFHIIQFSFRDKSVSSKWKAGSEKVSSILVNPDGNKLLSASKSIKLWNLETKEVMRSFTGHKSELTYLEFVNDSYFISSSKEDRLLNCWNLSSPPEDNGCVASFLLSESFQYVSTLMSSANSINLAVTVKSGVVHVFQHTLNGRSNKPIKPKTTVQIVSETSKPKLSVVPIHIIGSTYRDENTLCIGHGSEIIITFENIPINYSDKLQCIIRKDPNEIAASQNLDNSKLKTPIISSDTHYLTTQVSSVGAKRKITGPSNKVPLEERLENLVLNQLDSSSGVPRLNNIAQLLLQGLHSKDEVILRTVLCKREEEIIKNTLLRLPLQVIPTLLEKITDMLRGKTDASKIGVLWLKCLLQTHLSLLVSNPNLMDLLKPVLCTLDNRLKVQTSLSKFKGRLELLLQSHSGLGASDKSAHEHDCLLNFNDNENGDSEGNMNNSDSDDQSMDQCEDQDESNSELSTDNLSEDDSQGSDS